MSSGVLSGTLHISGPAPRDKTTRAAETMLKRQIVQAPPDLPGYWSS